MSTDKNQATNTAVAKQFSDNTLESVQNRIQSFISAGEIKVPENFSVENNLRFAYLMLQDQVDRNNTPVLNVCTPASVSNALLKMIVQGLSPAKHQCAFVAMGTKLTFLRQYQGAITLAKRMSDVVDVKANAIFEGDEFAYEINTDTGIKKVTKHVQDIMNLDVAKVKGAYAILKMADGTVEHEIMNINQIRKSWEMGAAGGKSKAHVNFTDEMACKTVINRACKLKIESSDDSDLYKEDEVNTMEATSDEVKQTIKNKANQVPVDFEDAESVDVTPTSENATDSPADAAPSENAKQDEAPKRERNF